MVRELRTHLPVKSQIVAQAREQHCSSLEYTATSRSVSDALAHLIPRCFHIRSYLHCFSCTSLIILHTHYSSCLRRNSELRTGLTSVWSKVYMISIFTLCFTPHLVISTILFVLWLEVTFQSIQLFPSLDAADKQNRNTFWIPLIFLPMQPKNYWS